MIVLILVYGLPAIIVSLVLCALFKPQAIGWMIAGFGAMFLAHAGATIAIIWAHNNEVPPYVDFWGLFGTIPTGLVMVSLGLGTVCVRSYLARRNARRGLDASASGSSLRARLILIASVLLAVILALLTYIGAFGS